MKSRRPYRLRARAEAMARTRRRITDAAVELHGSVGPGATTMTAIADRAGVTRATLYRHFANEAEVFSACSRAWLAANPRPDTASWSRLTDPDERIRRALREMYAYYRSSEGMLANLLRDMAVLPERTARSLASYPAELLAILEVGWEPGDARIRRAAILHAVSFETWRSLAREGLSDGEAADLMSGFVTAAAAPADPVLREPTTAATRPAEAHGVRAASGPADELDARAAQAAPSDP